RTRRAASRTRKGSSSRRRRWGWPRPTASSWRTRPPVWRPERRPAGTWSGSRPRTGSMTWPGPMRWSRAGTSWAGSDPDQFGHPHHLVVEEGRPLLDDVVEPPEQLEVHDPEELDPGRHATGEKLHRYARECDVHQPGQVGVDGSGQGVVR